MSLEQEHRIEGALKEAREGDDQAFAEIVREHEAMVFSIAWHLLADRSLAEDLAQEVFLEFYRKLFDICSAAHLINWLRRTAAHRCLDRGRRRKVRREVALESSNLPIPGKPRTGVNDKTK